MKKRREAQDKKASEVMDATPLLKYIEENRDKFTGEEKKNFIDNLHRSFAEVGEVYVRRAIRDKILTKKEIQAWRKKGIDDAAFCTIFMPILAELDGHFKDRKHRNTIIITTEATALYKNRKMIMKRFPGKFKIFGPAEALKLMKEAQKDGKKV